MKLPRAGREFWTPEMTPLPPGFVAIAADFGTGWVPLDVVEGARSVLIAGPDVIELPHPVGTVVLAPGRTRPVVKLIGPQSVEIVIRNAGVIDVPTA